MTSVKAIETKFPHNTLEKKWQDRWELESIYEVVDDDPRPKWFELTMYPYPSGRIYIFIVNES